MKKLITSKWLWLIPAFVLTPSIWLLAETVEIEPPTPEEIMAFLAAIGGLKGASILAIVAVVVQGIMLALRSPLGKLAGKVRLVIVLGLTLVGGVLGLMVSGVDLLNALMHSTTLAAMQVLANQIYKQFIKKANEPVVLKTE